MKDKVDLINTVNPSDNALGHESNRIRVRPGNRKSKLSIKIDTGIKIGIIFKT
jgi:hypothetical protein